MVRRDILSPSQGTSVVAWQKARFLCHAESRAYVANATSHGVLLADAIEGDLLLSVFKQKPGAALTGGESNSSRLSSVKIIDPGWRF